MDRQASVNAVRRLLQGEAIDVWAFGLDGKGAYYHVESFDKTGPCKGQLVLCWWARHLHVMTLYANGRLVSNNKSVYLDPKKILGQVM